MGANEWMAREDKSRIVEEGNYHKFTKSKGSPEMLRLLLETGERELVEVCCFFYPWRQVCVFADRFERRRLRIEFGVWAMELRMRRLIGISGVRIGWARLL
jgi:predicted NAD-dependent protein-ADP-ribosyltransferase YbiA (DUF1768 family)